MATNIFRRNQLSQLKLSSLTQQVLGGVTQQIGNEFFENGVALTLSLAAGISFTEANTKVVEHNFNTALSLVESISKGTTKSLSDTVSLSDGGGSALLYRVITIDKTQVVNVTQSNFTVLYRTLKTVVNTSGTSVTWVSGDKFNPSFAGEAILINGVSYTVATYTNNTTLVLGSSAGTQSSVICLNTPFLRTVSNSGLVQNASGFDIGFYTNTGLGTKLKWEIESWNPSTGEIVAWVLISTLSVSVNTTYVLGYGSSSIITDQSDPAGTQALYAAKWNFPDGSTLGLLDSTANNNDGSTGGATATDGIAGGGANFSSAVVTVPHSSSIDLSGTFSFSCSVRGNTLPSAFIDTIFHKENAGLGNYELRLLFGNLEIGCYDGGNHFASWPISGWNVGEKNQIAGGYDNGTWRLIFNGSQVATLVDPVGATPGGTGDLEIGRSYGSRYWDGMIDNLGLIPSVYVGNDWFATEYNNQYFPSTFYSTGSQVSSGSQTISKQPGLNKVETVTFISTVGEKQIGITKADNITLAQVISKTFNTTKADAITFADSLIANRGINKSLSDVVTFSDSTPVKLVGLNRGDTVVFTDSNNKVIQITKSDLLALSDSVAKTTSKALSDSITFSQSVIKDISKILANTISLVDNITTQLNGGGTALTKSLSDTIIFTTSLIKDISTNLASTITLSQSLTKTVNTNKSDSISLSDNLSKQVAKLQSDAITLTEVAQKAVQLSKADSITLSTSISKSFYRTLVEVVAFSDQNSKTFARNLSDTILMGDILSKNIRLSVSDMLTLLDIINPALSSKFGKLKRWDGNSWIPVKLWVAPNGTFIPAVLKVWTGTQWRIVDTSGI